MKTPTRLLFGVRTTGTVSLTIAASGQLPPQVPDLRICTSGQDVAVPCSNGTWVAILDAGDHVVHLPASSDNSLDGPLTFTLSAPATIVAAADPSGAPLVSWTTTIGATSSDPKNPWPPPATGSLDIALLADSTWLISGLTTAGAQAIVERSA
jgi:hypothetical protein